jgi:hypothetical protein
MKQYHLKFKEIKNKTEAVKKKTAPKIGVLFAVLVMSLALAQATHAQDDASQPSRAPYNPVVGQAATATVFNTWEENNIAGYKHDLVIVDVDGDGRTTDDQRMPLFTSDWLKKNPKYQLQQGDKIIYRR